MPEKELPPVIHEIGTTTDEFSADNFLKKLQE